MSTRDRSDESEIRQLIERWARAVREKNLPDILSHHAAEMVMFDVPPPFESQGIDAYRESWHLFYSVQPEPVVFDIHRLDIVAGADVAFAVASMQCREFDAGGEPVALDFRLTMGLRKMRGAWMVVHEHHSVPAV
jgi:ketosteroid isomerase-like protein